MYYAYLTQPYAHIYVQPNFNDRLYDPIIVAWDVVRYGLIRDLYVNFCAQGIPVRQSISEYLFIFPERKEKKKG